MLGRFQFIRKREAKRRFVAFWLFIVAIELFCPALCGNQASAASVTDLQDIVAASNTDAAPARPSSATPSFSSCEDPTNHDQSAVCNDECLCHGVVLSSIDSGPNSPAAHSDRVTATFAQRIFSSLPPPYLPPKFS